MTSGGCGYLLNRSKTAPSSLIDRQKTGLLGLWIWKVVSNDISNGKLPLETLKS